MAPKLFVAGLMAVCMAGVAAAGSEKVDAAGYTKADYKQCYADNPGCTGVCVDEGNGLVCVPPQNAGDDFVLCGGTKKNENWIEWVGGDAACTCAEGFVTSAKVVDMWGDSDGYPKADKLCTVDCGSVDNVECAGDALPGESGPLDCSCIDGSDEKASYDKEAMSDLKTEYEDFKAEIKSLYEEEKQALIDESACGTLKDDLSAIKEDFKAANDELKSLYEEAKQTIKDNEEWTWPEPATLKARAKLVKAAAKPAAKVAAPAQPAKKPVA